MTDQLKVLVICGSLRKGSYNAALARMAPKLAPPSLSFSDAPSFAQMPIYNFDDQSTSGFPATVTAWADAIRAADGLLIVSPEYNWTIPGGLRNAIDWVSRMKDQPFAGKPCAVQSAAGGLLGGSRMQYHLRQSLTSLDVHWFGRPEVIVSFAPQKFDAATAAMSARYSIRSSAIEKLKCPRELVVSSSPNIEPSGIRRKVYFAWPHTKCSPLSVTVEANGTKRAEFCVTVLGTAGSLWA
jgi:chromate reductase